MKTKLKTSILFELMFLSVFFISCSNAPTTDKNETAAEKEKSSNNLYIKNITAASLYDPLEKKGFKIDKQFGEDVIFVDCDKSQSDFNEHVRIAGDSPTKISEIRAAYTNYSLGKTVNLAKPFLGFIATLSYEGAKPEEARKWVEENLSKNTKIEINGVYFEIIANSKNISTLIITPSK